MEIRRESFLCIVPELFKNSIECIPTFVFLYFVMKLNIVLSIIIVIITTMLSIIITFLSWYKKIYYIEDDILYYSKGVFSKKELKTPIKNIKAVDTKQNLKQRIFKLKTIVIDFGGTSEIADLSITLKEKEANKFRNILLCITENNEAELLSEEVIYNITHKDLLIFSSTKYSIFLIISGIFSLYFIFNKLDIKVIDIAMWIYSSEYMLIFLVVFIIVARLFIIFVNYIKFYDYKVIKSNNILDITYGLVNKKKCSLNLDNVYAVKINQSLFTKLLNRVSIGVSTIGYGDSDDEESIVFPCINKEDVDNIIKTLFPRFVYSDEKYRIHPKYRFRYKNSFIGYNKEVIYLSGGIFSRKVSIISMNAVEDIEYTQNIFQKKNSIFKLEVNYKSKKYGDLNRIKGISTFHYKNIKDLLVISV